MSSWLIGVAADLVRSRLEHSTKLADGHALRRDTVGHAVGCLAPARFLEDLAYLVADNGRAERVALSIVNVLKASVDAARGLVNVAKLQRDRVGAQSFVLSVEVVDVLN
eukprot:7380353-Prymnesium_polylepis.1